MQIKIILNKFFLFNILFEIKSRLHTWFDDHDEDEKIFNIPSKKMFIRVFETSLWSVVEVSYVEEIEPSHKDKDKID